MTFACTLSGELVALDPAVIEAFAGRLIGRVLVESAAEYEQARRVWNGLSTSGLPLSCGARVWLMSWTRCDSHVTTICWWRFVVAATTSPASAPVMAAWSSTSRHQNIT
jgi:hypothetical protein